MKAWPVLLLGVVLASCAAGPGYQTPKPDVPARFLAEDSTAPAGAPAATPVDLAVWWRALDDVELNSLVDRAVKSNLDLEIALTRLQQARTYETVVAGHVLPEIDASASAAKGTGTDLARGRAQQALVSADNSSGLQHINTLAGFDAVWELDLFGKFRREIQAARFDTDAARAARSAVLSTVVADVVRAYIDLRGFQVRAGILRKASDALRESVRIATIRYQRGITNELDLALATRELDTFLAQLAPVEAQVHAAQATLAVLVGAYPEALAQELAAPQLVPVVPAAAAPGVPLDLLKRRPDIQQAERSLGAATARIGVATANLFPQVAIVGAIGAQSQGLGTLPGIGKHVWSLGPSAIWPLLDFGALDAQVDIADLAAQGALLNYRKTIINAVQEVDTALDDYRAQQNRLDNLGGALMAGQRALDLALARYERGLTDYLNVVDAQRQYYGIQDQYAQAQVEQGEEFVRLYKSLGGGWENYQGVPAIRRPQPAIVAALRRVLEP